MNEAQIRERLRQAVGEARYPAYLSGRVEARLKNPTRGLGPTTSGRRIESPWLVGLGRTGSFAAAVLVLLLIAALIVGANIWRNGDLLNRPKPAEEGQAIKAYQAMVGTDFQNWNNFQIVGCMSYTDMGCIAQQATQTQLLQQWLDDLSRSQPPTRFAALDALMRHHLARAIYANDLFAIGFKAKNDKLLSESNAIYPVEMDAIASEAEVIAASSQGTVVSYTAAVRADKAFLLYCVKCEQLVNQDLVSCQAAQPSTCLDEVAAVRLQVETFQGDLVFAYAPDSLTVRDARLQQALVAADKALDSLESSMEAGDTAGLQAGHDALRQALARVDSAAADITTSD